MKIQLYRPEWAVITDSGKIDGIINIVTNSLIYYYCDAEIGIDTVLYEESAQCIHDLISDKKELFSMGYVLEPYLYEMIDNGLISFNAKNFDLTMLFKQALQYLIEKSVRNMFSEIIFDYCANIINENSMIKAMSENEELLKSLKAEITALSREITIEDYFFCDINTKVEKIIETQLRVRK